MTEREALEQLRQRLAEQGQTFEELPNFRQYIEILQQYAGDEQDRRLQELDFRLWEKNGYALNDAGQALGLIVTGAGLQDATLIGAFRHLVYLDLLQNNLMDVRALAGLTQLTTLNLAVNELADVRPLAGLTQLTTLYLSNNRLTDVRPLAGLTQLRIMLLSKNQLTDVRPLAQLTQLYYLDLGREDDFADKHQLHNISINNQLTDITPLIGLTQLRVLNLSHNQLKDIRPLAGLTQLTDLNLSYNQLTDIKPLASLHNLCSLKLNSNKIADNHWLIKATYRIGLRSNPILPLNGLKQLMALDLSYNQLTDVRPLAGLTQLTELNVSHNQLTDVRPLAGLTQLTELDLSRNQLTDVRPLAGLTQLTELDLSSNQLTDVRPLAGLTQLTELDLLSNQLTDVRPLAGLTQLTTLNLSRNQLTDVRPLAGLTQLTKLDLSYNQLTDVRPLAGLTQLTKLNVLTNQLTDVKPLAGLTQLTILNLSSNRLTDVKPLAQLTKLRCLYLGSSGSVERFFFNATDNQLTDLTPLAGLTQLTRLAASHNQLTDVTPLSNMANLQRINLSHNQLTDLPILTCLVDFENDCMRELKDSFTRRIYHENDDMGELYKFYSIAWENNYRIIDWENGMREYNDEVIRNLMSKLQKRFSLEMGDFEKVAHDVNAFNNNLVESMRTIKKNLHELKNICIAIELSNNNITILPEQFIDVGLDIKWEKISEEGLYLTSGVNLYNNPLQSPPIDVIQKDAETVRAYFRQLRQEGKTLLYEAKLLIVGEPGAGKTTFAQKILNAAYELQPEEVSTQGIDVRQWEFPCAVGAGSEPAPTTTKRSFRVNIWDFGGQEIYKATHQFFLTKRSLYVLVADSRKEDTDFYYWLNIVALLSDNSPVIILKNEKQDRVRELPERQLRGEFTNLKEILPANLATNRGLSTVMDTARHYLAHLPHVGAVLPKTWVNVRNALEQDRRNYIPVEEYYRICERHKFTRRDDQLQLSGYLHDLGVCLHFQDDGSAAQNRDSQAGMGDGGGLSRPR